MAGKEEILRVHGDTSKTLAAKYRPRTFKEIVGQAHATSILKKSLSDRTVPQQILFSGGSGLGKTTLARVLGASLLCQTPASKRDAMNPCLKCQSCLMIFTNKGPHPDLVEFDAASYGGKDEIKEIANKAQLAPMIGPVKVYIIDEAHGLSNAGGQAFLKLLEEPPSHVVFILCTTDPDKMLKTNRGRCVEFELVYPQEKQLIDHIKIVCNREGYIYSDVIVQSIINKADPELGVRGVLMELSKVSTILKEAGDANKAEDMVVEILGLASVAKLQKLVLSIEKKNTLDSLDNLNEVSAIAGASSIKKYLIKWFSDNLVKSLQNNSNTDWYAYGLETLLNSHESIHGLQLSIIKISTLDPNVTPRKVLEAESIEVLQKITDAITEAKTVGARLYEVTATAKKTNTTQNSTKGPKKLSTNTTEAVKEAKEPLKPVEQVLTKTKTPQATSGASSSAVRGKINPIAAQLIAAGSPVPSELPSLLQTCELTKTDKEIIIQCSKERMKILNNHENLLRGAAGRLGMVLVFKEQN